MSSRFIQRYEPGVPFDVETYRQVITASHKQLINQPQVVASRLVGRLLRGLGVQDEYAWMLTVATAGEIR